MNKVNKDTNESTNINCDCKDKSQCWEPWGDLGNDEKYVKLSSDKVEGIPNGK